MLKAEVRTRSSSLSLIFNTMYGPELANIDFFLPAVLGVILMLLPTTLISVAIAGEHEKGTFELLIMSPLSGWEIIMGKLIAYAFITFLDLLMVIAIAIYGFQAVMRCSLLDIMAVSAIFLLGSLGLGLLASVLSRNQLQAYEISISIPALLFCGAFIPVELITPIGRMFSYVNPLYYFVKASQSVMIKGWPLYMMLTELTPLFTYALATLTCALLLFKRRVD